MFIGDGHFQHAGAKWQRKHCLPYYLYFIPENLETLDAIAVGFGCSVGIERNHSAENEQSAPNETIEESNEYFSDLGNFSNL